MLACWPLQPSWRVEVERPKLFDTLMFTWKPVIVYWIRCPLLWLMIDGSMLIWYFTSRCIMYHFSDSKLSFADSSCCFQFVSVLAFRVLTKPISLNVSDLILLRSDFLSHGYLKDSSCNATFFYGVSWSFSLRGLVFHQNWWSLPIKIHLWCCYL